MFSNMFGGVSHQSLGISNQDRHSCALSHPLLCASSVPGPSKDLTSLQLGLCRLWQTPASMDGVHQMVSECGLSFKPAFSSY